jgi:hypothetical protein
LNAAGLSLSGNVVSALVSAANITTTANITGGNIIGTHVGSVAFGAGTVSGTGNITCGNIIISTVLGSVAFGAGTVSGTGNIIGGNIIGTQVGSVAFGSGTVSGTGNITGGNIIGTLVGSVAFGSGSVSGTGNITGGNVITTDISVASITKTGSNAVGNIGSASNYFNRVFATATTALYADLAEKYTADSNYAPGTVLVFGGSQEVTISTVDADRKLAGVVSSNPSYLMNAGLEAEHTVALALQGRVPCSVVGNVTKGDMLVATINGAARVENNPATGSIIGKALEDFVGESGIIEVAVGRV